MSAAYASLADTLTGDDRDFYRRVWATDADVYRQRIRAAGFAGLGDVLDAGCGFGQWTLPLAETNRRVVAVDSSELRVNLLREAAEGVGIRHIHALAGRIDALDFPAGSFDGIFCYSVIYFTDYRKTVAEFERVLRPGGRLYLCGNGLGWYLHNLLDAHNSSATFDPAAMAVETLAHSLSFFATGERQDGKQIIIPSALMSAELEARGFEIVAIGPEGDYAVAGEDNGRSFYQGEYCGAEGVYEIVARKAADV